ncbi:MULTISPECIES: OmpA family protein [unclassified Campylobacter]|uniref:OmpA family protein n=1 Tax=unclassified Campylobacter TaxID=2593542 RepID=UPI001237E3A0|nr:MULTISPECIES: OmpA family protein [unclassified Campylobacter]KAA6224804.1 OmpA family protein [Campylobacter sp. LR185c]KAA6227379.1 OmpA family protein [Campylobacter sp. LR196d]KAA6228756.1 OmpA family protein [Campylobacter sp. LR286c]KAA6229566.1 OmpA family protein [Campylobacter sp. LR264d]KAA6230810.1 OmpA family protein [Campylobacter sp. LR291e]
MKKKEESAFWIAYADLMAGLLFVFILIIGAVIVKYVLAQSDLKEIKQSLDAQEEHIRLSSEELKVKENLIEQLGKDLSKSKEVVEFNKFEKLVKDSNVSFNSEKNASLDSKDRQVLILLGQLERRDEIIQAWQDKFGIAKQKVQNLGLLRTNLSKNLKLKLDDLDNNISINDKTGSIVLSATNLFGKDSYVLKDEVKVRLRNFLTKYFEVILNDEKLYLNIENILIEGHTSSDGSYVYNLDLSQKRAYELMNFIYTFNKDNKLHKFLIASGRSSSVPILKNGVEDKDASQRMEIKFIIKTNYALKDLENFFEFN